MDKRIRNKIVLILLLIAMGAFGYRLVGRWQAIQPPPKYNVIVFKCNQCGQETFYPQTTIARPVCGHCGQIEGEIRREMRTAPEAGKPPAKAKN